MTLEQGQILIDSLAQVHLDLAYLVGVVCVLIFAVTWKG